MRYIDKNTGKAEGNGITDEYLENECRTTDPLSDCVRYMNIDYSGSFTNKGYRGRMLELAMFTQKKYCCYCLRKIGNSKQATLEHIIPQNASSTSRYDQYGELSEGEIVLTKDYSLAHNQERPPYPHTIAWDNLVVSCKGQFPLDNSVSSHCCNNARGSLYAPPVYYLQDIESRITIMNDGSIHAKVGDCQDEIKSTIVAAKLNCTALKEIRRLWYELRNIPYREIVRCLYDRNQRMKILVYAFKDVDDFHSIFKYQKDDYWKVFMKYHLFYRIFKETY
jgi:hypothetical protein